MKFLLATLLLVGCATTNPYAYSGVMTPAECRAECASRAYPMIEVRDGACICETRQCQRPKHRGGCEQLPQAPGAVAPATQM